ncbi:hypothetical protein INT44_000998 [Umbelopsis vinacea]|uniref:Uncharacterized protein n=1 Tax=Umbelopsis vinacea TaxID=44442 RepID=A0A8H7Q9F6_9FUNG|nr:hypothetical protein INT44_000998 [Umbelopsis vinacea]
MVVMDTSSTMSQERVGQPYGRMANQRSNQYPIEYFLATTDHHLSALHVDALWKAPNREQKRRHTEQNLLSKLIRT